MMIHNGFARNLKTPFLALLEAFENIKINMVECQNLLSSCDVAKI